LENQEAESWETRSFQKNQRRRKTQQTRRKKQKRNKKRRKEEYWQILGQYQDNGYQCSPQESEWTETKVYRVASRGPVEVRPLTFPLGPLHSSQSTNDVLSELSYSPPEGMELLVDDYFQEEVMEVILMKENFS
jgi:hypothetical protein